MKCVLQSWLLLEESKARQPYDLQLKRTRPEQRIDTKKNISIKPLGPELRNFSLIVLLC